MKKNLIALLLSVVIAAGGVFTAPAYAAESDREDAAVQEQETPETEPAQIEAEGEAPAEETAADDVEEVPEDAAEAQTAENTAEETSTEGSADSEEEPEEIDGGTAPGEETPAAESTADAAEAREAENTAEESSAEKAAETEEETGEIIPPGEMSVVEESPEEVSGAEEAMAGVVDSGSCGTNASWKLTGTGSSLTLTISGSGKISDYESDSLPWKSYVNKINKIIIGSGITELGTSAFTQMSNVTEVSIPGTVTSIGWSCFAGCTSLSRIQIPDGVKMIGGSAFSDCRSLTSLTIPDRVSNIFNYTFSGCSSLKNIEIPDGVTFIGISAFAGCSSLTGIQIPDSVRYLSAKTFCGCKNLRSIKLPESMTSIGFDTFEGCSSLASISIPDGVTTLYENVFEGCSSLTSVTIPDSVTKISAWAFYDCTGLESIRLSGNLASIEKYAFCNCKKLKKVVIPEGVKSIGEFAFTDCTALTSITIPASVSGIGMYAFGVRGETNAAVYFRGTKEQWESAAGENEIPYKSISYNYFSADAVFKLSGTTFTYTGKPIKPAVTVTCSGSKLAEGKDYELEYKNNKNAGTASVVIRGIGDYSGAAQKSFTIKKAVNKITAKNFVKTYSAKAQSFALGVKITNGTPKYVSSSKSVTVSKTGTATVKAGFVGSAVITVTAPEYINYSKTTKKITIKVNPSKTAIVSAVSPAAGKMTVKWKKNSVGTGYQVQYSTSSAFATVKSAWISKNTSVSKTITGLAKGKKYYVRVRTIKTVSGVKYYSGWSEVKAVTIKK